MPLALVQMHPIELQCVGFPTAPLTMAVVLPRVQSKLVHNAYQKDMKAGLLIHRSSRSLSCPATRFDHVTDGDGASRITEAERNEIDLAEALGPNAMIDKEKEAFKKQKEKAQAFVRADGKQVGGTERVQGDVFSFLNKLFQHEMKRAGMVQRSQMSGPCLLSMS
jgi:hypothetical protein